MARLWTEGGARRRLALILLGGLAVRLLITPFGGFDADIALYADWAAVLADEGPRHFYEQARADHLPGDLWVLWLIAEVHPIEGGVGAPYDSGFEFLIKLTPILADTAIAVLLFAIGRRLAGERAGLGAAALYAFNPAPIFLASVWGQWDSLSAAFALLGVWCVIRGWYAGALPALTYAALIKPQLGLIGVFALIVIALSRPPPARYWRQILVGTLSSAALTVIVTVPFGAAPWAADSSIFERARVAIDLYPAPDVSAFNFWYLWFEPFPAGLEGNDGATFFLGASFRAWSIVLLSAALLAVVVRLVRMPRPERLVWGCLAGTLATFVLATRMHERYLLPAVVFAVATAVLGRRWLLIAALVSLSCLANLYWIYDFAYRAESLPLLTGSYVPTVFSLLNIGLLIYVLLLPPSSAGRR